ncbi:MAG TPA: dihydrolipoamide acetyltransferase family protein [Aggregatilineales bacterium]|nr:dihydrolipoamide acetyltransferase family protein [Aggregatilineales bacterium]
MPTKVIMPQLGESVVEGTVSKWLKRVGDSVEEFEPILEVSTDKVDTEIPSPAKGVILQIYVPEGTTVERGVLLAMIGQPGEAVPEAPDKVAAGTKNHEAAKNEHVHFQGNGVGKSQRYSPVVARMAAENKIDLSQINGTGLGGRVTKKDVEVFLEQRQGGAQSVEKAGEIPPWEQPIEGDLFKPTDEIFAKASGRSAPAATATPRTSGTPSRPAPAPQGQPGQLIPHTTMRRAIAEHMVRSKLQTAPHVTTVFELDMSRTMAHWKASLEDYAKQGVKLTLTAYFMTALVQAVRAQPLLNAQWTDDGLFVHHMINVGMAVALPEGLIVPVIKNAQDLNLMGLARQVSDLAARARSKALHPDDIVGGTITLTNHGVSGSLLATPIINQPQSAIVGTGIVQKRAIVLEDSDSIAIRPMMYATLTFDHRVADGAMGDAFMRAFKDTLENWS